MTYRIETPGQFYDCGEETVVYFDSQSGDTHLVGDFTAHIIKLLAEHPMELATLIDKLSCDIDSQDLPELTTAVPDILEELVALDIVETV